MRDVMQSSSRPSAALTGQLDGCSRLLWRSLSSHRSQALLAGDSSGALCRYAFDLCPVSSFPIAGIAILIVRTVRWEVCRLSACTSLSASCVILNELPAPRMWGARDAVQRVVAFPSMQMSSQFQRINVHESDTLAGILGESPSGFTEVKPAYGLNVRV